MAGLGDGGSKFTWPGFGDNVRVLEWILGRLDGTADAQDTPIGRVSHRSQLLRLHEPLSQPGAIYKLVFFASHDPSNPWLIHRSLQYHNHDQSCFDNAIMIIVVFYSCLAELKNILPSYIACAYIYVSKLIVLHVKVVPRSFLPSVSICGSVLCIRADCPRVSHVACRYPRQSRSTWRTLGFRTCRCSRC